jgi:hypothetical protein
MRFDTRGRVAPAPCPYPTFYDGGSHYERRTTRQRASPATPPKRTRLLAHVSLHAIMHPLTYIMCHAHTPLQS